MQEGAGDTVRGHGGCQSGVRQDGPRRCRPGRDIPISTSWGTHRPLTIRGSQGTSHHGHTHMWHLLMLPPVAQLDWPGLGMLDVAGDV